MMSAHLTDEEGSPTPIFHVKELMLTITKSTRQLTR